jgi:hypothetical protein
MDPIEFLNSDIVDLPKTRNHDLVPFVDRMLDDYGTQIQRVANRSLLARVITSRLPRVETTISLLREAVRRAVDGDRDRAYSCLDEALVGLGPHFDVLCPSGDMSLQINPMYRFRTTGAEPFDRGGLFHIPFQLRHIVGQMRYSVAGLPCLYLGGSTYVCWRELGEPALNTVTVSRFAARPDTNLRVLNFGRRMPVLAAWVYTEPQHFGSLSRESAVVAANVACWPLVAVCSIRVPDRRRPERPEYLIPQLLLEWITRTRAFHGIRYFSTHYSEYHDDPKTYMNYVFPARTDAAHGHCTDLAHLFQLTEPRTWPDARELPASQESRPRYKLRGQLIGHLEDEFGRAEDGLLSLPFGTV